MDLMHKGEIMYTQLTFLKIIIPRKIPEFDECHKL